MNPTRKVVADKSQSLGSSTSSLPHFNRIYAETARARRF